MSMLEDAPLSLDDEPNGSDAQPAKDTDGIPYCQKHHCRMKQGCGGKKNAPTSYYYCKVKGCGESGQRIKTPNPGVVPGEPLACPRCSKGGKPVHGERDPKASTAAMVILKCPSCGWKSSAFAVPQLAAAHFAARQQGRKPPIENLGDR
jgi:hypothetical protein